MALKKQFTSPHGVTFDAYCRVENVVLDKKNIAFAVFMYADGGNGAPALHSFAKTIQHDFNGPNTIKQVYDHLKTLPEFSGAADC